VAALAGTGQGADATDLGDEQRARWRKQALDWLREDLALLGKRLDEGTPQAHAEVAGTLRHWQKTPDLAGLRDDDALAKLPEAEREACRKLWADVESLGTRKNPQEKDRAPRQP
jgi:serine/threonine-protein kinase